MKRLILICQGESPFPRNNQRTVQYNVQLKMNQYQYYLFANTYAHSCLPISAVSLMFTNSHECIGSGPERKHNFMIKTGLKT